MATLGVPLPTSTANGSSTSYTSSLASSRAASPSPSQAGLVHKMPSSSSMATGSGSGYDDDDDPENDPDIQFDSAQEEAAYYREKYRRITDMLAETRAELDDFQASSRELEEELEKELAATEKQQEELKEKIKRLEAEKEDWKNKHVNLQKMHSSTVGAMQREMDNLRSERDKTLVALRDLEMGNDELERNERVAASSLLDLESKYNRAIEEKTLLEQELVDKQHLDEKVQRLTDELRDANSEISILRDQATRAVPTPPSSIGHPMSPVHEVSLEVSLPEIPSFVSDAPPSISTGTAASRSVAAPSPRGLARSSTLSSLSGAASASPLPRRTAGGIPHSPSALALGRSTSITVGSAPRVSGIPPPSPSRSRLAGSTTSALPVSTATVSRGGNKGIRILQDLQARIRATDDKLGKMPSRRNVSAPIALASRRSVSGAVPHAGINSGGTGSTSSHSAPSRTGGAGTSGPTPARTRVAQLAKEGAGSALLSTPANGADKSSMMSPSSWVMVTDDDGGFERDDEESPSGDGYDGEQGHGPASPLEGGKHRPPSRNTTTPGPGPRAVSAASRTSTRTLPSRPGIPSPLANPALSRSTSSAAGTHPVGSASSGLGSSTTTSRHRPLAASVSAPTSRPRSRASMVVAPSGLSGSGLHGAGSSAPLSPSLIPGPSSHAPSSYAPPSATQLRASLRSPSPAMAMHSSASASAALGGSTSGGTRFPRPPSREAHVAGSSLAGGGGIGRGPPPGRQSTTGSVSVSVSASTIRRPRRSSVGSEIPTAIPGPKVIGSGPASGSVTPMRSVSGGSGLGGTRPASVVGLGTPPPPVPRIPSSILRDAAREKEKKGTGTGIGTPGGVPKTPAR